MNVLSLFGGISCGHVALDRAGINVKNYYASEVDKYATKISDANDPDIIRLGDVIQLARIGYRLGEYRFVDWWKFMPEV